MYMGCAYVCPRACVCKRKAHRKVQYWGLLRVRCVCAMIPPPGCRLSLLPAPVRLTVRVTCARCYAGVRSLGYAALSLRTAAAICACISIRSFKRFLDFGGP